MASADRDVQIATLAIVIGLSVSVSREREVMAATIGRVELVSFVDAPNEAERQKASREKLRTIGRAMSDYHKANGTFPARSSFDKSGKPLLSWRVHLLPFLGESKLYKEFKLDEPWDSPHNKKLIERMPAVFKNPNNTTGKPMTNYLVPVGKGTMFEGNAGIRRNDITDGEDRTIMAVEADDDRQIVWTTPDDFHFDAQHPVKGLEHLRPDGFLMVLADGRVILVHKSIDLLFLPTMFTYRAGDNEKF